MRIAYADPPYIGQAKKHYSDDPRAAEVDHKQLIEYLNTFDAWALSCSSSSLQEILSYCPARARVMAWVKPFASFKPGVGVAYAWEPVIVHGLRPRARAQQTVRDWCSSNITLQRGVHGAKPEKFCYWLFEVLNLELEDEFFDLYPGSGAITRALDKWRKQQKIVCLNL